MQSPVLSATATPPAAPLIHVICVAYRRYGPLKVLVQSWINQTAPNWRLSVLHDGPDPIFAALMEDFVRAEPERISYTQTTERHNDYGHTLRDLGLQSAQGDYVLLTNDDNYYVPRCVEYLNEALMATGADVGLFDMIHSHDRPGGRPQPAYCLFETQYSRLNIDIGAAVIKSGLARAAGFRDRSHDGDASYFEDVARAKGAPLSICKIPRVLFVHN